MTSWLKHRYVAVYILTASSEHFARNANPHRFKPSVIDTCGGQKVIAHKEEDDTLFVQGANTFESFLQASEKNLISAGLQSQQEHQEKERKIHESNTRISTKAKRFSAVLATVERNLKRKV